MAENTKSPKDGLTQEGAKQEKACVEKRNPWVLKALAAQGIKATQAPLIAVLGSGGGMRAHIGFLGVLSELKELGLLDAIMYLAGVSGSTWAMSSFYSNHGDIAHVESDLKQRFEQPEWAMSVSMQKAIESSSFKNYSLTDFWAYLIVSRQSREFQDSCLSSLKKDVEAGALPYPVFAAIDNDLYPEWVNKKNKNSWFEFTPHHAGYPALKAYIPIAQFGSQFKNGNLSRPQSERDLSFLRGLWGSAVANAEENKKFIWDMILSLKDKFWHSSKRGLERNDEEEISQYTLSVPGWEGARAVWHSLSLVSGSLEGNGKRVKGKGGVEMARETSDVEGLLLDFVVTYKTDPKAPGLPEMIQALSQALNAIPEDGPEYAEKMLKWETMSEEEQGQFLQLVPYPFLSLGSWMNTLSFLNKTIACFWNWEWGTVYNFLHELVSTDDKIAQEMCNRKLLHLVDAGLAINSAYPLVLPPARDVQLILSFDFSAGDPFETVLATADYCKQHGIPFPPVDKAKLKQCAETPDSCYIFKGDTGPTVMHFPLFNQCNCVDDIEAWRNKYGTFKISDTYTLELVQDLLDKAKENVRNSKQKILDTIKEMMESCSKSS
ncbi:cytosolic phospholipase A2 gamma [Dipodomys spectabilis]|uniref:cytosolic phospholipase A2 gamma n=1 Tax=Dipodomys spectabilis TaxID=105255 RepID=UPI001C5372C1|nr:cytosolic phospholipase A2 gamma [Dipodomys spectabilis]